MSLSKSWGIVAALPAVAGAALCLLVNRQVRWFLRCGVRLPRWLDLMTSSSLVLAVIAFAAVLTIATEAARNANHGPLQRFGWVLVLLAAGPVAAPLYWALYLRKRS